jgi:hypothetical protein
MRLSSWGGWTDGFCVLAGHELQFFPGASPGGPSPGARPQHKWELVGAHLRLERAAELALTPAGGSPTAWLAMPSEQEAHEWMVGLAQVPGLFRWGPLCGSGSSFRVGGRAVRTQTCRPRTQALALDS